MRKTDKNIMRESYKKAEQFSEEIISVCIQRGFTLQELKMLETALPIKINEKISEQLSVTKLL